MDSDVFVIKLTQHVEVMDIWIHIRDIVGKCSFDDKLNPTCIHAVRRSHLLVFFLTKIAIQPRRDIVNHLKLFSKSNQEK